MSTDITDAKILEIGDKWAKEKGWMDFERSDFVSCVREIAALVSAPAGDSTPEHPSAGWRWMTHPDWNDGEPMPVLLTIHESVMFYQPFSTDTVDFEWDLRDDQWKDVAAPAAPTQQGFIEPTWKDEPPDWCTPKEEEVWQIGYDAAMSSCRSANSKAAAPVAEQTDRLPREEFASLVVQEACETEPADPDDPETIKILARDLKSVVLAALLRCDLPTPHIPVNTQEKPE